MVEPVDKLGRTIYPKTFRQMQAHEAALIRLGYRESIHKSNLFFRATEEVVYFADMRGTDMVALWEDPRPMFYVDLSHPSPIWRRNRLTKAEVERLHEGGCSIRFSFYSGFGGEWSEESDWDGYCHECERNFQWDGLFCSKECEERDRRRWAARRVTQSPTCTVCRRKIVRSDDSGWNAGDSLGEDLPRRLIYHHVSYNPEKTIEVCQGCHNKIHHGRDPRYERWRPRDAPPDVPDSD